MSHRRKEKDIKKYAAETLIDTGSCFFRTGTCDKNFNCEHCDKVPGFSTDPAMLNSRQLNINLKKARGIKKSANFKDKPSPPPPPSEPQKTP